MSRPEAALLDRSRPPSTASLGAGIGAVLLALLIAAFLSTGNGGALALAVPVLAGGLALFLCSRRPTAYICLVLWAWLLTPELRRLVDYQAGWSPTNQIMLTPYVVTLVSVLTLLRRPAALRTRWVAPLAYCLAGVAVGFTVGVVRAGPNPALYGALEWGAPFVFGVYIALLPLSFARLVDCIWRIALWGCLVVGTYGIVQFFWLPSWDAFWMRNAPITTIGQPKPLEVRVFSSLNSPGPLATVLVVLLLLLAMRSGPLKGLAVAVGSTALALSLVRSAWLGIALGVIVLIASRRSRDQRQTVRGLLIAIPLVIIFTQGGPISTVIAARASSLGQVSQDVSFNDRLQLYQSFSGTAVSNPLGAGIGATGAASRLSNGEGALGTFGNFDSGILELPFVLGWLGAGLFVWGLVRLVVDQFRAPVSDGRAQAALSAVIVAGLSGMIFVNVLKGVSGVFIVVAFGLAVKGRREGAIMGASTSSPRQLASSR